MLGKIEIDEDIIQWVKDHNPFWDKPHGEYWARKVERGLMRNRYAEPITLEQFREQVKRLNDSVESEAMQARRMRISSME